LARPGAVVGWEDDRVTGTEPTPSAEPQATTEPVSAGETAPIPGTVEPLEFSPIPDIRLIACDMDGTLLDDDDAIHDDFWPLIDALHERGVVFCPASGRQYYNLLERFEPIADEVVFIAENGTYVVREGRELSSDCLDRQVARELIDVARDLNARGADVGAVLCGKASAYIERRDAPFLAEVDKYYHRLQVVDDLNTVDDDILKVAIYDFESSEKVSAPAYAHFLDTHQVVVSGQHWLDVMDSHANKGSGIRHIQQALGITRDQTMVFGDFLNDLEMMDEATYSFAMANAHPELAARARFRAPENTDNGVVRTIKSVLGLA
jgi:Cof subfamily protein (haloacid dehalogenase superfamily)